MNRSEGGLTMGGFFKLEVFNPDGSLDQATDWLQNTVTVYGLGNILYRMCAPKGNTPTADPAVFYIGAGLYNTGILTASYIEVGTELQPGHDYYNDTGLTTPSGAPLQRKLIGDGTGGTIARRITVDPNDRTAYSETAVFVTYPVWDFGTGAGTYEDIAEVGIYDDFNTNADSKLMAATALPAAVRVYYEQSLNISYIFKIKQ